MNTKQADRGRLAKADRGKLAKVFRFGVRFTLFYRVPFCRSEASEGTTLNTETIKRFSDCDWYVLMEFSVAVKSTANALATSFFKILT